MESKRIKRILEKYEKATSIKNTWNNIYDEIYSYVLPQRGSVFDNVYVKGERQGENKRLYSSVPISSAHRFVNRMQELVTPINSDWIGLEAVDVNKTNDDTIRELNINLNTIATILNNMKNGSNFDSVISEFYFDLVAGTACLLVLPGDVENPIIYKTIPFKEYCISEGYDGTVREVYRKFNLRQEEIRFMWKEAKDYKIIDDEKKDEEVELIECCLYSYENKNWEYIVIDKKNNKELLKRIYKNNPFIILRWNKASGEYYGRGVGYQALPDIKTLNMAMDYSLRVLAYQLPIFLAEKESFDDDFLPQPMAINFVQSNETSKPSITQLQVQGNNDISQYNITNLEMAIKRMMLDNTIPDDSEARTATEIQERTRELQSNLSSVFGRIVVDFLYPLIKRMLEVLQLFNYIDPKFDMNKIDGYNFKVNIKTPLSLQNKQQNQQDIINTIQLLLQIDNSGQYLNRYIKLDDMFINYLNNSGIDKSFVKSIKEIAREEENNQMAQQQQMASDMNNQVNMSNAIEFGKAQAQQEAKKGF